MSDEQAQESLVTLVLFMIALLLSGGVVVWLSGAGTSEGEVPSVFAQKSKLNDALSGSEQVSGDAKSSRVTGDRVIESTANKNPSFSTGEINSATSWPCLYGPTHDAVCVDPKISLHWPKDGPKKLWTVPVGVGYSSPVVASKTLVTFHRIEEEEVVEGRDPLTGAKRWTHKYPTEYVDRYQFNGGPRSTPIIDGDSVYTLGAEGKLHCLETTTGKVRWMRDINAEYKVEQGFFGVGASPILEGDRIIINVGGATMGAGVVAFDKTNGKTIWEATRDGASYSTPRAATIHGKRSIFAFTDAGLNSIEPATGKVDWSIPFRSKSLESVNASSPLIAGDVVLVSATYNTGSLCIRVNQNGGFQELWRDRKTLETHFSNMLEKDGYVYAISGRNEIEANLRCLELATGKLVWQSKERVGYASLVRVGAGAILLAGDGHLLSFALSPLKFELISKTKGSLTNAKSWAPLAIADGRIYIQTESSLSCFDLSK